MTLQINLKQLKAEGASNSHVLAWSNAANSWVSANVDTLTSIPFANASVSGTIQVIDSTTNTSILVAASANTVRTAYNAAVTAQNMAANAFSNAVTYAADIAATAYSNAIGYATSRASDAYANAITYAAANSYVNSQLNTKASLSGATFTGAVAVSNTISTGNTTVSGYANVTGNLDVGGILTVSGNLVINGTTTTVNTSSLNVADSLLYLASNNEISDSLDIGFVAHYNNGAGANGHTGLFRSAISKKYYLFQNLQPEPIANNTIDTSNTASGIQMADLVVGNLVANSTLVVTGAATLNNTLAAGNTTITGKLIANTGLLSANTIQFNDGSQQSTFVDPIAMAIALG
jgi:cytoskeletal protein CcmA (bactofilin family)